MLKHKKCRVLFLGLVLLFSCSPQPGGEQRASSLGGTGPKGGSAREQVNTNANIPVYQETIEDIIQAFYQARLSSSEAQDLIEENLAMLQKHYLISSDGERLEMGRFIYRLGLDHFDLLKNMARKMDQGFIGVYDFLSLSLNQENFFLSTKLQKNWEEGKEEQRKILPVMALVFELSFEESTLNAWLEKFSRFEDVVFHSNVSKIWEVVSRIVEIQDGLLAPDSLGNLLENLPENISKRVEIFDFILKQREKLISANQNLSLNYLHFEEKRIREMMVVILGNKNGVEFDNFREKLAISHDPFDKVLNLKIKIWESNEDAIENFELWREYRQVLASALHDIMGETIYQKSLGLGDEASSLEIGPGIYTIKENLLMGRELNQSPLALLVKDGGELELKFQSINGLMIDLSPKDQGEKAQDLTKSRGKFPEQGAYPISRLQGNCQQTGTGYVIVPGESPSKQIEGDLGENGAHLILGAGGSGPKGFSMINLQGGRGGIGARGISAINCGETGQALISLIQGEKFHEVCKQMKKVGGKTDPDWIQVENARDHDATLRTSDYSLIAAGEGGDGGRGGVSGVLEMRSVLNFHWSDARFFIFPGIGGPGGDSGICGVGAGGNSLRGKEGELGKL